MTDEIYRTERIIIQPSHPNYDACRKYCFAVRKVYNQACYLMRQGFFKKAYLSHSAVDKVMKRELADIYELLPSAIAQRTIQVLGDNWSSFFEASKDYAVNPSKYKARPKLPGYYCVENNIGNIVIGLNRDWKQDINIGKVNNQKFVSIPHAKLIDQIRYKADTVGIKVVVREESYTSKASALDLDTVPTYDSKKKNEVKFSGRRVKRGLYKTVKGYLLNADVNGAANILRKEIGDGWLRPALESIRALWTTPVVWKPNQHTPLEYAA